MAFTAPPDVQASEAMPNVRLRPKSGGLAERVGYRLDRFLALHPLVQLAAVLVWATALALLFAGASLLVSGEPDAGMRGGLWWAITHMLDGGTVSADQGFLRRFLGVGVTLVGMVLVAIVTGAFASSFADRLRDIRRGTSIIFERGHVLLLGFGARGDVVLRELAASGARLTVVIVTAQAREIVEEQIRDGLSNVRHRLKVIIRRADPQTTGGVRGASASRARAIAILPDVEGEAGFPGAAAPGSGPAAEDLVVLRTLLAARRALGVRRVPLIVEVTGENGRELVHLTGKHADLTLVQEGDIGTHLLVHSVRQPGVLDIVREILSLDARSVYIHPATAFAGRTFDEAHSSLTGGILVGLLRHRERLLSPPGGTLIEAADRLLVLADDSAEPGRGARLPAFAGASPSPPERASSGPLHVLVIGYRRGLDRVLRALRAHLVTNVTLLVQPGRGRDAAAALAACGLPAGSGSVIEGDTTSEAVLSRALAGKPARFLLLARDDASGAPGAPGERDVDQLLTLLSLRHVHGGAHLETPAIVEIHDPETERLVGTTATTDFILLREIVGRLLAQEIHAICLDETAGAWLGDALHLLLEEIGTRVWLDALPAYLPGAHEPTFGEVMAAARARGEVAIGVRPAGSRARLLPERGERFEARGAQVVVLGRPERRAAPSGEAAEARDQIFAS